MAAQVDVQWRCDALRSTEDFELRQFVGGWTLAGDVDLLAEDAPVHISYRISASLGWVANHTSVAVTMADRRIVLEMIHRDGAWTVDGRPRPDLAGCTDVDLGWTPATNTIPLRRRSGIGGRLDVRAAWVTLPGLEIRPVAQRYEQTGPNTWRYTAGTSDHLLEVSDEGLVLQYGDDLWRAARVVRTTG